MSPVHKYSRRLFPSQLREERVFVVARRHWFAALAMLVPVSVLFLVPFIVLVAIGFSGGLIGLEVWYWDAVITGSGAFLLFAGFVFMVAWMSFYYDFQIVTDRRIVEIDQHRLFSREIGELTYDTIEDIKVSIKGFFGTYLNFGDIEIQTAAEHRNFVLEKVPFPHKIAKIIADINSQCNQGIPPDEREPRGSVVGLINGQDVLRVGHKPAVMNYERNLGEPGEEDEIAEYEGGANLSPSASAVAPEGQKPEETSVAKKQELSADIQPSLAEVSKSAGSQPTKGENQNWQEDDFVEIKKDE